MIKFVSNENMLHSGSCLVVYRRGDKVTCITQCYDKKQGLTNKKRWERSSCQIIGYMQQF